MLSKIFNIFKNTKKPIEQHAIEKTPSKKMDNQKSIRKGELGEYKVTIQLDQMPKEYRHLSDLLLPNPKAKSGYSQIDHILVTPYAIFIIETKNYSGEIKGGREDKHWTVNKRFKMLNPFYQNYGHIESIRSIIQVEKEHFVSLVSFTRRCTFSVDPELRKIGSNDLIVYDIELTEFIQRKINRLRELNKEHRFTAEQIESMYELLKRENITDSKARASHVEGLKSGGKLTDKNHAVTEHTCVDCGKTVTEKIAKFCLANQSRFQGKVYCYEHQKTH
ncbi:NERD domain-containing protein [Brevibacillus ruminantium]|uniref:NERD domain-containing protein n=1 Tax=Brevibacillus ruminantium TaxID=2950604 RepID=A0ABY4WJM4_9BACL|nr:nuclease-related domain-containing protein [Brevibacillus ruminantium]USG67340.1 NERD domain-containing protein [Brevibacillus ruminantium]